MHATACVYNNYRFLIMGCKRAGKTKLLNYILENNASYLSNDRTFITFNNSKVSMKGFLIPMRISLNSLDSLPIKKH